MASNCCGTKKQRMINHQCNHNNQQPQTNQHLLKMNGHGSNAPLTNGHANHLTNGHSSGLNDAGPNQVANREMCFYGFEVLYCELFHLEPPPQPNFTNDAYPLFVTWHIGKERKLRGCIGTFSPLHLHSGLQEYALTSALRDSRFSPISRDEFSKLTCSVSILQNFEDTDGYLDWTIGVHGIRIEFNNERGSKRNATYLPQVAHEQGWNQIQTIDSLLRKGGYRGHITPEVRNSIKLTRYQSSECHLTYAEYRDMVANHHQSRFSNGVC